MFGLKRDEDPVQLKFEIDLFSEINMPEEALNSVLSYVPVIRQSLSKITFPDSYLKFYFLIQVLTETLSSKRTDFTAQARFDPIYQYADDLKKELKIKTDALDRPHASQVWSEVIPLMY